MILGKSVAPCEGENLVKSYLCTEFNSKVFGIKAKGYLEVTNKRLLFQALGSSMSGWSVIHNEVSIADVSEIKIYKGASFNLMMFIAGVILAIMLAAFLKAILLFAFDVNGVGSLISFAGLVYAIYWLYKNCRKEAFSLLINTKGGQGNVVNLAGLSPFSGGNTAASKALVAAPGKDSELMMKEIGALVLDIQSLGDYGIEKWTNKTSTVLA